MLSFRRNRFPVAIAAVFVLIITFYQVQHQVFLEDGKQVELESANCSTSIRPRLSDPFWFLEQLSLYATMIDIIPEDKLTPGPVISFLFNEFKALAQAPVTFNTTQLLINPKLIALQESVREKVAIAEYKLELHSAKELIFEGKTIRDFIYYYHYEILTDQVVDAVKEYSNSSSLNEIKEIAVIGSGPIPLTAVLLAQKIPHMERVTCYDRSEEAIEIGKKMIEKSGSIQFVQSTVEDIVDLTSADIVHLAVQVGLSAKGKEMIIKHLHKVMKDGALLLARTAVGLNRLFYPVVGEQEMQPFQDVKQFRLKNMMSKNAEFSVIIGSKGRPSK